MKMPTHSSSNLRWEDSRRTFAPDSIISRCAFTGGNSPRRRRASTSSRTLPHSKRAWKQCAIPALAFHRRRFCVRMPCSFTSSRLLGCCVRRASRRAALQAKRTTNSDQSDRKQLRINGHAYNGVRAQSVEIVHFLLAANAARDDKLTLRKLAQPRGGLNRKSFHEPFTVHMRIKKRRGVGFELRNRIVGRDLHLRFPAFHCDAAAFGVDTRDHTVRAHSISQLPGESGVHRTLLRKERGADNDASSARIEHLSRALDRMNAAAGLARQPLGNLLDERGVVALAHGRIQVNELHKRKS